MALNLRHFPGGLKELSYLYKVLLFFPVERILDLSTLNTKYLIPVVVLFQLTHKFK